MLTTITLRALACAALCAGLASAQKQLLTTYASDNGGSSGWGVFFDLNVVPAAGIVLLGFEVNVLTPEHTPFTLDVYTCQGSYVGKDGNVAAWTLLTRATAAAAPMDTASVATLAAPVPLPQGARGIAIYHNGAGPRYTTGTGSNQTYSTPELTLTAGITRSALFAGSRFDPRVFNGAVWYDLGTSPPSFLAYGAGCAGTNGVPRMKAAAGSAPKIGTTFSIDFTNLPLAAGTFALVAGISRTSFASLALPFDLSIINMTGCFLYASAELTLPATSLGNGVGSASIAIPGVAALVGAPLYVQPFVPDAGANPFGLTVGAAAQILVGL